MFVANLELEAFDKEALHHYAEFLRRGAGRDFRDNVIADLIEIWRVLQLVADEAVGLNEQSVERAVDDGNASGVTGARAAGLRGSGSFRAAGRMQSHRGDFEGLGEALEGEKCAEKRLPLAYWSLDYLIPARWWIIPEATGSAKPQGHLHHICGPARTVPTDKSHRLHRSLNGS